MGKFFSDRAKANYIKRLNRLVYVFEDDEEVGALSTLLTNTIDEINNSQYDYSFSNRRKINKIITDLETNSDVEEKYLQYYSWMITKLLSKYTRNKTRDIKKINKEKDYLLRMSAKWDSVAQFLTKKNSELNLKMAEHQYNGETYQWHSVYERMMANNSRLIDAVNNATSFQKALNDSELIEEIREGHEDTEEYMHIATDVNGAEVISLLKEKEMWQKLMADKSSRIHKQFNGKELSKEEIHQIMLDYLTSEEYQHALTKFAEQKQAKQTTEQE